MSHGEKRAILVFLKAPVASTVKTRLAQTAGDDMALRLYRCFILDTLEKADTTGDLMVFYFPEEREKAVFDFLDEHFPDKPWPREIQKGKDLGERMARALGFAFEQGYEKALLIGTDSPDMPVDHIIQAFRVLDENDAVIGPSHDGGYVLIGFNQKGFNPVAFHSIAWSTDTVFEKTLEIMAQNRISCETLPLWYDVDIGEDFEALVRRLDKGHSTATHTFSLI